MPARIIHLVLSGQEIWSGMPNGSDGSGMMGINPNYEHEPLFMTDLYQPSVILATLATLWGCGGWN